MMKKKLIAAIVLGMVSCCTFILLFYPENDASLALSKPTSIRIERDTMNLGTMKYGEKRELVFRIYNTGGSPLFIRHVEPSCGCTQVDWPKRPVAPGASTKIDVTFEPASLGRFMKSIRVLCNTAQQEHKLNLQGQIVE